MDYTSETLTISFNGSAYAVGDYACLHSNSGSGDVDWDTAHINRKLVLNESYSPDTIEIEVVIATPGYWTFGFESYDVYGNAHYTGTPAEESVFLALQPKAPDMTSVTSFDFGLKQLILGL